MRISRAIGNLLVGTWRPMIRALQADPVTYQALDLAAVGSALGLTHHRADERADRLLVAALHLLDGGGVRLDDSIDDHAELVAARHPEAAACDDRVRVATLGSQHVEHLLAGGVGHLLL